MILRLIRSQMWIGNQDPKLSSGYHYPSNGGQPNLPPEALETTICELKGVKSCHLNVNFVMHQLRNHLIFCAVPIKTQGSLLQTISRTRCRRHLIQHPHLIISPRLSSRFSSIYGGADQFGLRTLTYLNFNQPFNHNRTTLDGPIFY